jgi:solute carrier family 25, member 33/36
VGTSFIVVFGYYSFFIFITFFSHTTECTQKKKKTTLRTIENTLPRHCEELPKIKSSPSGTHHITITHWHAHTSSLSLTSHFSSFLYNVKQLIHLTKRIYTFFCFALLRDFVYTLISSFVLFFSFRTSLCLPATVSYLLSHLRIAATATRLAVILFLHIYIYLRFVAMTSTSNSERDNLFSVAAGGFAGVCSTCVTNPLDTIRVRLSAGRAATGKAHKSLLMTAKELFNEGLVHAFGRGLGANIMASMPSNAVYLPTYRFLKNELTDMGVSEQARPLLCAFGAVTATNVTLSPLFLVRTRVQVDDRLTIRQVFTDVMRRDGIRGFYRGTVTNVAGRFVEEGCFWTVYELLKRLTHEGNFGERGFWWTSAAMVSLTMMAKLAAVSIAYPYNVVMNHLRTVNKVTGKHDYVKVLPTIRHIYRADGFLGFYKGLAPQILRSVISKATQIYSFELALFTYAQMYHQKPLPVPAGTIIDPAAESTAEAAK